MKLLTLDLLAFGPFTERTLDFTAGQEGLHVVYGPNEAGKTSALRALTSFFFGIPKNSTDNFRHEHSAMRIGASLRHSDGGLLSCVRRKGKGTKNTLTDATGVLLEEWQLARMLGGIDEGQFTRLFGITHDGLRAGGDAILSQGGEVGQSLFTASLGGVSIRSLLAELEAETDELFSAHGHAKKRVINAFIHEYDQTRTRQKQATLSSAEWQRQRDAVDQLVQQRTGCLDTITQLNQTQTRLRRIKATLPNLARRRALQEELVDLADVTALPVEFPTTARAAIYAAQQAESAMDDTARTVDRLTEQLANLDVPDALLLEAETLIELHQRLGSIRKAAHDRVGLVGEAGQSQRELAKLADELPVGLTLETVRDLRIPKTLRERIRQLGSIFVQLRAEQQQAEKVVKQQGNMAATLTAQRAQLVSVQDSTTLIEAVASCRKAGNLEALLATTTIDAQRLEMDIVTALKRIPLWCGTLDQAEVLQLPLPETVERYAAELADLDAEHTNLGAQRDRVTQELVEVDEQLAVFRLGGDVPLEDDLTSARTRREDGWVLIRHAWIDGADVTDAATTYAEIPLQDAYADAVTTADEIADRLRRESERVARLAELHGRQDRLHHELGGVEQAQSTLEKTRTTWQQAWSDIWSSVGITPATPAEMRALLTLFTTIRQQVMQLRTLQSQMQRYQEQIVLHRQALSAAFASMGEPVLTGSDTLDILLERAQRRLDTEHELTRKHSDLVEKLQEADRLKHEAATEVTRIERELATTHTDWQAAISVLGLAGEHTPEEVAIIIDIMVAIKTAQEAQETLQGRIAGIDRDSTTFDEAVINVTQRLQIADDDRTPAQIVTALHGQVLVAKGVAATRATLQQQLTEQTETLGKERQILASAQQHLTTLLQTAGKTTIDELHQVIVRAERAVAATTDLAQMDETLLRIGDGHTIVELEEEAATIEADVLPGQLEAITADLAVAEAQRDDLNQRIGEAQNVLQRMDGTSQAAEAAEEAQRFLAAMRAPVQQYLHKRLAAILLRQEIERYRQAHQDPLLARASDIFTQLTLNAFVAVRTEYDDHDQHVLVGVRDSGEEVAVSGMSDGTRDQLFLALRLASLESYIASSEPVPFIVDDILITFDDERAAAALAVLADFSQHTQVIFFTHHQRLVDLAEKLGRSDCTFVQHIDTASLASV